MARALTAHPQRPLLQRVVDAFLRKRRQALCYRVALLFLQTRLVACAVLDKKFAVVQRCFYLIT